MDLGPCLVGKNKTNILCNAVNPRYGVAWSDGKTIFLSPVDVIEGCLETAQSIKLGQFEHVSHVAWSCNLEEPVAYSRRANYYCYLSVVHKDSVTIWKVTGHATNLVLTQVRKINSTPLPQGCLWNPSRDMLCIVSKERADVYFDHCSTKGHHALPPSENNYLSCGCWSVNGNNLLLGCGTSVLVYSWLDIEVSFSNHSFITWEIPEIDGSLLCLSTYDHNKYVCTSELPLEKLCRSAENNLFDLSHMGICRDASSSPPISPTVANKRQSGDSETLLTINRTRTRSHTSNLLALKRHQIITQDSSRLIIFEFRESDSEPRKLGHHNISDVIAPDLLVAQLHSEGVVVGSNTTNTLEAFSLKDNNIRKICELRLDDKERPSGLCNAMKTNHQITSDYYIDGVLIAVGEIHSAAFAFPSSSSYEKRHLVLKYFPIPKLSSDGLDSKTKYTPTARHSSPITTNTAFAMDSRSPEFQLLLPNSHSNISYQTKPKVTVIHDHGSESVHTDNHEQYTFNRKPILGHIEPPEISHISDTLPCSAEWLGDLKMIATRDQGGSDALYGQQLSQLEHVIKSQSAEIAMLNEAVSKLGTSPDHITGYSSFRQPKVVTLVFRTGNRHEIKKSFLLDDNRLKLDSILQSFGLETLELCIGGVKCTVSANADGYIPLIFTENTTVHINGTKISSG